MASSARVQVQVKIATLLLDTSKICGAAKRWAARGSRGKEGRQGWWGASSQACTTDAVDARRNLGPLSLSCILTRSTDTLDARRPPPLALHLARANLASRRSVAPKFQLSSPRAQQSAPQAPRHRAIHLIRRPKKAKPLNLAARRRHAGTSRSPTSSDCGA